MTLRYKYQDVRQDLAEAFVESERSLSGTLGMLFADAHSLAAQLASADVTLQSLFSV
jgi:hypothetical protein